MVRCGILAWQSSLWVQGSHRNEQLPAPSSGISADAVLGCIPQDSSRLRSNLFTQHFRELLEAGPLPEPAASLREMARQSLSAQVRAADREGEESGGADAGGKGKRLNDAELAEGAAKLREERARLLGTAAGTPAASGMQRRKGRMGAEIKQMRERLLDLGLLYAQQKSVAPGRRAVAPVRAPSGGQFCVGKAQPDKASPVAEALDEIQQQAASPRVQSSARLQRKLSGGRRGKTPPSKGSSPRSSGGVPLPPGPVPSHAVSLSHSSLISPTAGKTPDSASQAAGVASPAASSGFATPAPGHTPAPAITKKVRRGAHSRLYLSSWQLHVLDLWLS